MPLGYSARDKRVNKALKNQKPICSISYNEALDILLRHFQATGQIPNTEFGCVIGLNPYDKVFEVHPMPLDVWVKVTTQGSKKGKARKGRKAR